MPRRDEFPIIKSYAQDKVKEERKKWKEAIEKIKAEISQKQNVAYDKTSSEDTTLHLTSWGRYWAHDEDIEIIDKHTKELMK